MAAKLERIRDQLRGELVEALWVPPPRSWLSPKLDQALRLLGFATEAIDDAGDHARQIVVLQLEANSGALQQ
jgi:hypothetical protein